jgi:hypothetical protein
MATAIEMLTGVKGQTGLWSHLGRWMIFVSKAIDQVISAGGAGGAPQYYEGKNANPQAIGADTNIIVDQTIAQRGITKVSNTEFQLTPGKTYHLIAYARATTFSGATDVVGFRWVNGLEQNVPLVGDAVAGRLLPETSSSADSSLPYTDAIYTPTTTPGDNSVKLRAVNVSGSATIPANGVQITIIEIPGG